MNKKTLEKSLEEVKEQFEDLSKRRQALQANLKLMEEHMLLLKGEYNAYEKQLDKINKTEKTNE